MLLGFVAGTRCSQLPFSVFIRVIQYGPETHEGLRSISLLLYVSDRFSARCTCTNIVYRLAHAKKTQSLHACNIQSNCTFLVSYWKRVTAGQVYWKRVTAGQVFVLRPPVVSRSENRTHQCQAIKFFNNIQAFSNLSVGGNTKCSALCTVRLGVLPGMPANMWARNIEHLTCLC